MITLTLRRTAMVLVLGAVAPYLWVESHFLWSMNVYIPVLKWLWVTFTVKGEWIPVASGVVHDIIAAAVFALTLRFIARRAWALASAVFCMTFLVAFFVPGLFESDTRLRDLLVQFAFLLPSVLVLLAFIVALSALLSRFPRPHGA